eukprot:COSAG01_NODE_3134_length_6530_cov_80.581092_5_plen_56_part_00
MLPKAHPNSGTEPIREMLCFGWLAGWLRLAGCCCLLIWVFRPEISVRYRFQIGTL